MVVFYNFLTIGIFISIFGPKAEFLLVFLPPAYFFICLSRVSDGGLDAVLVVQRVTKAKDEGELSSLLSNCCTQGGHKFVWQNFNGLIFNHVF